MSDRTAIKDVSRRNDFDSALNALHMQAYAKGLSGPVVALINYHNGKPTGIKASDVLKDV